MTTDVPQVLAPPEPAEIRAKLEQMLIANILGPEGGDYEELDASIVTSVRDYYLVGMLAPRSTHVPREELDGLAVEGTGGAEEATPDISAPTAPSLFPSSLGMTFGIDADASEIQLTATWGRYDRVTLEDETDEDGKPRRVWRREPAGGSVTLVLEEGKFESLVPDVNQPEVTVRGRIRRADGGWVVTAFLVNEQDEPDRNRDSAWLFQVKLEADAGGRAIFRKALPEGASFDQPHEDRALEMAYRHHVEFAVGHGVGVHATADPTDPRRATRIETAVVPAYEVPRTDAPTADDILKLERVTLDMSLLARAEARELVAGLRPLVELYRDWIASQRTRIGTSDALLEGFEETADRALRQCERMAERISSGIDLLDPECADYDPLAIEAFRFANEAMWQQRVHSIVASRRREDSSISPGQALADADVPKNRSWRPFQLAFVLLNLPSLSDPRHAERGSGHNGLVDLLWFPTGGGKTEAYLGLAAFTLAIRRYQGTIDGYDGTDGVGVLMRYTLRLLTVQQFQRAAALMCACEQIRRQRAEEGDNRLGPVPFRLGLWVGYTVTPTTSQQSGKAIEEAKGTGWYGGSSNPVQLTHCPWCGTDIDGSHHAEYDSTLRRTRIWCGDQLGRCPFTRRKSPEEGIPVLTVDEEIYRLTPGMVIATADKFAQMPWRGPIRALFGRVSRRCERHGWRHPDLDEEIGERDSHPRRSGYEAARTIDAGPLRPPDLIIQDELHLISGPLGSLMGLYETAVDELCTWKVDGVSVRPKVVASTATVRRAQLQAYKVFWRSLGIFPPPALDAGDSFFALQRNPAHMPGRRYLGVCAPGRRIKAVEIRLYVALMGAAQRLFDQYGAAVDPWMTLVGYFSALRELAGMSRLVDDDVKTRLGQKAIAHRGLGRRFIWATQELTSRIDSTKIPQVLDELSIRFGEAQPQSPPANGANRQRNSERYPIDVLLATNMVSVGVDVPRLGLMVVGGQPKATAEYIQATSRVGRSDEGPGLVVTALNWARPRDLSHYEAFEHFHATFYQHVEAQSVTPFALRSLDRGLTAVMTALIRHQNDDTNANQAPQVLRPRELGADILLPIRERGESITSRPEIGAHIWSAIEQRLDSWLQQQGRESVVLGYRERQDGKTLGLLKPPGDGRWDLWTCAGSLREVEAGVNLLLTDREGDRGPDYEYPIHDQDEDVEEAL